MKKVRFITWAGHSPIRKMLGNLKGWYDEQGWDTGFTHFTAGSLWGQLEGCSIVYMWNGAYGHCHAITTKLRKMGTKVIFCEVAWFPQMEYLYFDEAGTNGNCSLHTDSLGWLNPTDFTALDSFREAYLEGRQTEDGNYIFVPMQLSWDTQIKLWSPFDWMGQLITRAREVFSDHKVIFRKHPKDGKTYEDLDIGSSGEGDLKDLVCGAHLVYGINSTVLLEAALMGKTVISVGKSFLDIGPSREHALAALVARQVPIECRDFTPWMERGRGLEHLRDVSPKLKTPKHLGGHSGKTHVDQGVLAFLQKSLGATSLLDVGCGVGGQLQVAKELGFGRLLGVDGDPNLPTVGNPVTRHDFSEGALPMDDTFALAWSCEFVEHVREEFVPNFMSLFQKCKHVALTHAPKGKAGHHHVNCRNSEYWIDLFEQHGFTFLKGLTSECRGRSTMKRDFFRENGLVFMNNNFELPTS